ncbi:uncharacterized protein LOC142775931 [Rhipicephalus microplus]|uniref:Putative conserved secreted protein n=1 Tax=Rhipicephalus microplus TaxID=6941 RepID=A0A6M2CZE2_RHIMP
MRALVVVAVLCALLGVTLAGFYGHGISFGHGGGHGYHKTVPGPSFLVKTVHHVHKLHHGGTLFGHAHHGYGGGYGGGHGGVFFLKGGYGHGYH